MAKKQKKLVFKIDFDGTCVLHDFPFVGEDIGAAPVLKAITDAGNKIILWTVRSHQHAPETSNEVVKSKSGEYLNDAIKWFQDRNIPIWKTNEGSSRQKEWTSSPKPHADRIIDDLMIGDCVGYDKNGKRYVKWNVVLNYLFQEQMHHDAPIFKDASHELYHEINAQVQKEIQAAKLKKLIGIW